jgi:DNA polymerase I-like protein with 3'-5' exonuclease and polymerase domains
MISIDYESLLISNDNIFPKPVCLSYFDGKTEGIFDKKIAEEFLGACFRDKELIIAHNAVFECGVTVTHFPDLASQVFDALDAGLIYCTRTNEALWNIQREKKIHKLSLADLVKHYYGVDISESKTDPDAWRLRYSELDGIPIADWPKEAIDYAIDDSIWAYRVYQSQQPINQNLALKSAVYLNLMGAQGFRIDQERVEKLESELWEFLTPRYDYLVGAGYCDYIAGRKTPRKQIKKLQEYIESQGLDIIRTEKGGISTDAEAMAAYQTQKEDPIIKAFSELSKYEKILSTYISHMKGAPKIYTSYSTTMNTGRTSSSSSKFYDSVNIQNQPREVKNVTYDVRNCYVPRPGFKVFSIDYGALELCSAAHQLYTTVGYSAMRTALNEGNTPTDMHSKLAAKIKGISYEEFMAHKAEFKSDRQKAKPINLGFPGGIGYDTMKYLMNRDGIKTQFQILEKSSRKSDLMYYLVNLGASDLRIKRLSKFEYALVQDELVLLKRHIFGLYPELEEFLKETHKKFLTGDKKWQKNDFGEWEEEPLYRYQVGDFVRDRCTYTATCNGFLMQTPSAIGAQRAMNRIIRTYWNHPDIIPQAFIHDEVVGEVRENCYDQLDGVANILMEEMQSVLTTVRIAVETSVSDFWQKADGFYNKTMWKDPE